MDSTYNPITARAPAATSCLTRAAALLTLLVCLLAPSRATAQIHFKDFQLLSTAPTAADLLLIDSFQTGVYHTKTIDWRSLLTQIGIQTQDQISTNTTYSFYTTNLIDINSYLSNYFATNVLNCGGLTLTNGDFAASDIYSGNAYISNWFSTNIFEVPARAAITAFLQTNHYTTNAYTFGVLPSEVFAQNATVAAFFATNAPATNDLTVAAWLGNQFDLTWTGSTPPSDSFVCAWLATNVFQTNLYVSNLFATNIVAQNTYVSNFFATNVVIYQDTFVSNFFATNIYSPLIVSSNFYTTNLIATTIYSPTLVTSNSYTTNLIANKITVNNILANDGTFTNGVYFVPHLWSGPTNPLPLYYQRQYYDTYTPVYVTGLSGKSNTVTESVLLSLANLASSNVTVRLHADIRGSVGTNVFTLTNGTTAEIWFDYVAVPREKSNAVYRPFL